MPPTLALSLGLCSSDMSLPSQPNEATHPHGQNQLENMQQNIEKVNDSLSHLVNRFVPLMANMGHTRPDAGASSQQ